MATVPLEGFGASSVYTLVTGSNTTVIEVGNGSTAFSGIEIRNLKIDGNDATFIGHGIYFNKNITYSLIYNVEVYNVSGEGGIFIWGSNNNTIDSCVVHNNDAKGILIKENSNRNIISNNNAYSNGYAGIELYSGTDLPVNENIISSNIVEHNGHGGIIANGNRGEVYYNTIVGNICNWNADYMGGIYLAYSNSKYNTITGNTCNNNIGNGIQLYEGSYNTITGNVARDNNFYYGIYLQKNCYHNIVANNILSGNFYGLGLYESKYNIINSNQIIFNDYYGARIFSNSDYSKISNNYVYGNGVLASNYSGFSIEASNCELYRNTYISNATQRYGINITVDGNNNTISHEMLQNGGTLANISDLGSGNSITECIGYTTESSGTATLANATTSIVVTHSLAATPTRIQLTPTTDTAGKRYWISAKGVATFTITIDSTHTSDISFDWRAVVGEGN